MSGLVRGKIECVISPTLNRQTMTQSFFKTLYDYFTWHPNYSLIALNYGSTTALPNGGGSAGTGTGYYDQPNCFGYNAFFVVRQNATAARPFDVYHLFQWAGSVNQAGAAQAFGGTPGNPGLCNGTNAPFGSANNSGVGHAAAIGIGGSGGTTFSPLNGNPWKGTSNVDGADTKPATGQIWGPPPGGGTGIIIFPRSNNGYGAAFRTQTQNTGGITGYGADTAIQTRIQIVGDDDSFAIAFDPSDSGAYVLCYSGIYSPRTSVTTIPYPYCVIDTSAAIPWSYTTTYGDLAGTSGQQGGIVPVVTASSAPLQMDHYSLVTTNGDFWPNAGAFDGTRQIYDELDIMVASYEVNPFLVTGILGEIDFVREMFGVQLHGLKSDYSRMFVGSATAATTKYSIPWDSENKTVPRTGNTRTGIYFVAPSLNPNA